MIEVMSTWGGKKRYMNSEIFCLDMSTSQTSYSKINNYLQMGIPLEQG